MIESAPPSGGRGDLTETLEHCGGIPVWATRNEPFGTRKLKKKSSLSIL